MADRGQARGAILGLAAFATLGVAYTLLTAPTPMLVYNATASVPLGFYRVAPGPLRRGDFVLARLPDPIARFAAARDYLPASVPLVKRIAAVSGDRVCTNSGTVRVNGLAVAFALTADGQGRRLAAWQGCRALAEDEVFLLVADVRASFDGRYFGPVASSTIIGRLVPLWTW